MQLAPQPLGPTEEDARLARCMQLLDAAEHHVPVRAAEVRGRVEARDCVRGATVEHDVLGVAGGDFGGQVL